MYTVNFENVSVTAAQDLVQITGPSAGKIIKVHRVWLSNVDTSLITGQAVRLRCRYLPATVTVGSGGTTGITPSKKEDQGDAACSSTTAATNNTTPATTSGTAVVLMGHGTHLYVPFDHVFTKPIIVGPSTAFVFELLSTVSASAKMNGGCDISEEG